MVNPVGNNELRIDIIDVGQGDSIFMEGPDGTTMLVDSGPWYNSQQILDYLDEHDVDHLDYLVATHDDADHIGGHADIIEEFGPDGIGSIHGPTEKGDLGADPSETKLQYEKAVKVNDFEVNELKEGDTLDLDGVTANVLNPSQAVEDTGRNEDSVVLHVEHDDHSVLLAGDVEGDAEDRLSEQYSNQLHTVTAAKVAHHGAENGTSSNTLAHTGPDTLLISSSLTNQYTSEKNEYDAHPHDEMLKRVHEHEGKIDCYWTAYHGTTSLIVGDGELQIEPANSQNALSETDVAALKYYGRANDLDNEQLTDIEGVPFAELPGETPKWACEAPIVDTSQSLTKSTDTLDRSDTNDAEIQQLKETIEKLESEKEQLNEKNEALSKRTSRLLDDKHELLNDKNELIDEIQELHEENLDLKANDHQPEPGQEREAEQTHPGRNRNGTVTSSVGNKGKEKTPPTGGKQPTSSEATQESAQADNSSSTDSDGVLGREIPEEFEKAFGKPMPDSYFGGGPNATDNEQDREGINREDEHSERDDRDRDADDSPASGPGL